MRPHEMSVEEAKEALDDLGSSQDPIWLGDFETVPENLDVYWSARACMTRISYYRGDDPLAIRKGTLSGMVADRRRMVARHVKIEDSVRRSSLEERLADPGGTLVWWRTFISDLITEHGTNVEMHVHSAYNNATLEISPK